MLPKWLQNPHSNYHVLCITKFAQWHVPRISHQENLKLTYFPCMWKNPPPFTIKISLPFEPMEIITINISWILLIYRDIDIQYPSSSWNIWCISYPIYLIDMIYIYILYIILNVSKISSHIYGISPDFFHDLLSPSGCAGALNGLHPRRLVGWSPAAAARRQGLDQAHVRCHSIQVLCYIEMI